MYGTKDTSQIRRIDHYAEGKQDWSDIPATTGSDSEELEVLRAGLGPGTQKPLEARAEDSRNYAITIDENLTRVYTVALQSRRVDV